MSEERRQLFKSLGFLSSVGISLVAAILIGLAMGHYLDLWFDTKPIFTLVMLGFGVVSGFRNVFILTKRELRRQEQQEDADDGQG